MKEIKKLFALLSAAVTASPPPEEVPENINAWLEISRFHKLEACLSYGILEGGYPISEAMRETLFAAIAKAMQRELKTAQTAEEAYAALSGCGADFMPIKGIKWKELYAHAEMRSMVDVDILVRLEEREKIEAAMEAAGFAFVLESNHEYVFEKNGIEVELHKFLVPSYHTDLYSYWEDGWKFAVPTDEKGRYTLGDADGFLYLLTHFAKHYRDAGVGIRPLLDLWLYKEKIKPDLVEVSRKATDLGLHVFLENVLSLLNACFSGGEWTPLLEEMVQFMLQSGDGGTLGTQAVATAIRTGGKKSYFRVIFPTAKKLAARYARLRKRPWLLPFYRVRHLFTILLSAKALLKRKRTTHALNTAESRARYKEHMDKVGIKLCNGRK